MVDIINLKYRGSFEDREGFRDNTAVVVPGSHGITAGAVSSLESAA